MGVGGTGVRATGRPRGIAAVDEVEATDDGRGIGLGAGAGEVEVECEGVGTDGRDNDAAGAADRAAAAAADALAEADGAGPGVGADSALPSPGVGEASALALAWAARRAGFGERVPSPASVGVEEGESARMPSEGGGSGAPPARACSRRRRTCQQPGSSVSKRMAKLVTGRWRTFHAGSSDMSGKALVDGVVGRSEMAQTGEHRRASEVEAIPGAQAARGKGKNLLLFGVD